MTSRLITPPTTLAISLADAKANLHIDPTGDTDVDTMTDTLLKAWILGITGFAEKYTGRAIMQQEWRVTLDAFPETIRLPRPPVVSVLSLSYVDVNGAVQTIDPADYYVDADSAPGRLVPAPGKVWPATLKRINAVTADVRCGYGNVDTAVPAEIRLFLLAKLREQYDPAIRPEKDTVQSSFLDHLLDGYIVYSL